MRMRLCTILVTTPLSVHRLQLRLEYPASGEAREVPSRLISSGTAVGSRRKRRGAERITVIELGGEKAILPR